MSDPTLPILIAIFVGAFGACIGSFLNVCIYRIPRNESVVSPGSHCPHCNQPIPWHLNIPVLTWLVLRGRCRFCRGPITPRYLLVELLTAVLFLLILFQQDGFPRLLHMQRMDDWLLVPVYIVFTGGLILGTFVDFEFMEIPDSVTIGGSLGGTNAIWNLGNRNLYVGWAATGATATNWTNTPTGSRIDAYPDGFVTNYYNLNYYDRIAHTDGSFLIDVAFDAATLAGLNATGKLGFTIAASSPFLALANVQVSAAYTVSQVPLPGAAGMFSAVLACLAGIRPLRRRPTRGQTAAA